jgi:hypothetical protein
MQKFIQETFPIDIKLNATAAWIGQNCVIEICGRRKPHRVAAELFH